MKAKRSEYDVVIIGAGVAGCCCARELSRYDAHILVIEAGLDIAEVTTRANSGIVHAGYDPVPGTLKAKYNVWGAQLYPMWAQELGFQYEQNGAMIVGFSEDDTKSIHALYERGLQNGVEGMHILTGDEARQIEPELSPDIISVLHVTTSGICDPYQVAFRAAENAANNGVEFILNTKVEEVSKIFILDTQSHQKLYSTNNDESDSLYEITTSTGQSFQSRAVINAAGLNSDVINNMVSDHSLKITPKRGEYCLFDTQYGECFTNTIFQCPTKAGKGVLVSPTVHGNLFIGPTSEEIAHKQDFSTSVDGLGFIQTQAKKSWPGLDMRGLITNFSGVRACGDSGDFVVGEADDAKNFFNIACLESPGLSSAPAIAVDLANKCSESLNLSRRKNFIANNTIQKRYFEMNDTERREIVKQNPDYGHVICRCRQVTEGEILQALNSPIPVLSIDALKWRTGATMGRCHGGFCTPELVKFLCNKYNIPPIDVNKRNSGSWMFSKNRKDYLDRVNEDIQKHSVASDLKINSGVQSLDDCEIYDVAVVGGGAAGLAAAQASAKGGANKVVLIDRENHLGGILKQCIHSGFGLHHFNEELTGPEYAGREVDQIKQLGDQVQSKTNTFVTSIQKEGDVFTLHVSNKNGYEQIKAYSVVLSSGSRERGFGSLNVAGTRPSGIYTAGSAQNFINLQGVLPGKNAVILGSGDIGLIMARRMILSGMKVKAVYEIMPKPSGLKRNITQCLEDFDIPLHLSHTVVATHGESRLNAVTIAEVDENLQPIAGTEERVECDTLVLSVGLIPESELAIEAGATPNPQTKSVEVTDDFMTSVPGLFACGNALHIHDLVDFATAEGEGAGKNAAIFAAGIKHQNDHRTLEHFHINNNHKDELEAQHAKADGLTREIICTSCPNGCTLIVEIGDDGMPSKIAGNKCKRGIDYAINEIKNPSRNFSSIIMDSKTLEPISVKTSRPIPKSKIAMAAAELRTYESDNNINVGDTVVENIIDSGVDIVATKSTSL